MLNASNAANPVFTLPQDFMLEWPSVEMKISHQTTTRAVVHPQVRGNGRGDGPASTKLTRMLPSPFILFQPASAYSGVFQAISGSGRNKIFLMPPPLLPSNESVGVSNPVSPGPPTRRAKARREKAEALAKKDPCPPLSGFVRVGPALSIDTGPLRTSRPAGVGPSQGETHK